MVYTGRREDRFLALLNIGHTLIPYHMLGKDFSFKQQLNNFSVIRDNSGLIFGRKTTEILSRSVVFVGSRLVIRLETSLAEMSKLLRLCSVRRGKMGR